jgi:hypothetical protein
MLLDGIGFSSTNLEPVMAWYPADTNGWDFLIELTALVR